VILTLGEPGQLPLRSISPAALCEVLQADGTLAKGGLLDDLRKPLSRRILNTGAYLAIAHSSNVSFADPSSVAALKRRSTFSRKGKRGSFAICASANLQRWRSAVSQDHDVSVGLGKGKAAPTEIERR